MTKSYTRNRKTHGSKRRTFKGEDQGRVLARFLNDDGVSQESRDRIARLVKLAQTASTGEPFARNEAAIEFNALAQFTARPFCVVDMPVAREVTLSADRSKKTIKAKPLTTRFDLAHVTPDPTNESSAFWALFRLAQDELIGSVRQCARCQKWMFSRNPRSLRHRFCSDECSDAWYAADPKEKQKRKAVSQQLYWRTHWYFLARPKYSRLTWQERRELFLSLKPKPRQGRRP